MMSEDLNWESTLTLKGERFDDIPYEELCRRANGLPPKTDYVCVDTREWWEKGTFFWGILLLTVLLSVLELVLF